MSTKRKSNWDKLLPDLKPIKGLSMDAMRDHALLAEIAGDIDRARRAQSFDPNRCHCPRCTVIGGL